MSPSLNLSSMILERWWSLRKKDQNTLNRFIEPADLLCPLWLPLMDGVCFALGQWLITWTKKRGYLHPLFWLKNLTLFEAYGPEEIKIEVVLHNGDTVEGFLEMCNLHYNIAIVTIEYRDSLVHLPAVELMDLPLDYSLQPRPVIALGRDFDSKAFLVRCGELVRERCQLDCRELLVCLCDIRESEDLIGGPIMDYEKKFLGITYCFEETAPFLPVEIAARCIGYHKKKRTLPWLRIRGKALHTLDLDDLETICCKFAKPPSGLLVDKICDTSIENYGGIEVGDIISKLDGAALYSGAQFTAMFLDKFEVAMDSLNAVTLQAVVHRPRDKTCCGAECTPGCL